MADHSEFVLLAQELITAEGRAVTLQRMDKSASDVNKPWQGATEQTPAESEPTFAVFLPPAGTGFGRDLVSEEMLQRVEQICLVPPGDGEYEGFDTLLDSDGQRWGIEWMQVLKPADQVCLYAFGVKR